MDLVWTAALALMWALVSAMVLGLSKLEAPRGARS